MCSESSNYAPLHRKKKGIQDPMTSERKILSYRPEYSTKHIRIMEPFFV